MSPQRDPLWGAVQRVAPAEPPTAAELAAALKRSTFLLSSARLVIFDPLARRIASEAVAEHAALLARCPMLSADGGKDIPL